VPNLRVLSTVALAAALLAGAAAAQEKTYPHINLAASFTVDPAWPQRPPTMAWDAIPGVAVDAQDQVWLFVRAKPPVQVYDAAGKFVRAWDNEFIQSSHSIRFGPDGTVWVADNRSHVVMQFTPEGKRLKVLGVPGVPGDDLAHFNRPTDMVITPQGDVFVSDGYGNDRVVHVDRSGKFVKAWGKLGTAPGEFSLPHSIVMDSRGRLYVADRNNVRVQVFDQDGKFLAQWRNLMVPWNLCITKADEIWACGCSPMTWRPEDVCLSCPPKDQIVMKFNTEGKVLQVWTFPLGVEDQEKPGELDWLHGIAVDSKGNLYLTDIKGKRAQKFIPQP
jgi:sugar lactone lactonase YvrE